MWSFTCTWEFLDSKVVQNKDLGYIGIREGNFVATGSRPVINLFIKNYREIPCPTLPCRLMENVLTFLAAYFVKFKLIKPNCLLRCRNWSHLVVHESVSLTLHLHISISCQ